MGIKIEGYSEGDRSVGIGRGEFSFDTGLNELDEGDKEFIINNIVRAIWELHDNGDLRFNFSDEINENDWDYSRSFSYKDAELKLCDKCKIIQNL